MCKTLRDLGIEIPPGEETPLVRQLVGVIERLVDEIHELKGLPKLPKRAPIAPSPLPDGSGPPSQTKKKRLKKRKRPKNHKRSKLAGLPIQETVTLEPEAIPVGAKPIGSKSFFVRELKLESVTIRYRRMRYRLPDGTILQAKRPDHLRSQFGPTLRAFVLYQYFHNQVTEPLIRKQLGDLGIDVSSGQISRMLTEGHDPFHMEKESLLAAAREVSTFFQTDDTGAKHNGKNGHTLHIGNELFAYFVTSDSKNRLNFLEVIRRPYTDYVLNDDGLFYLECHKFPVKLLRWLRELRGDQWIWENALQWEAQLDCWKIESPDHRRQLTEAAVWGSVMLHDLYVDQPFLSDDAGQFKLFGFAHGLCWLHAERHVARLVPLNPQQTQALEAARDSIWYYYQKLKRYREQPTQQRATRLRNEFETLFLQTTQWPALNDALQTIHSKQEELLLVLDHPQLPLHNNLSENDIRQFAKLRKISASSRSELGRKCRDTFISLKTTCRKLSVSFWNYLRDRITSARKIQPLGELIVAAAAK
jgi:hypothetical protein